MSFHIDEFVANPSQEVLTSLRKCDLLEVAEHYKIEAIRSSMLKSEIKRILVNFLVEEDILPETALEILETEKTDLLKIKQMEFDMKVRQMEMEERAREREERERDAQMQRGRERARGANAKGRERAREGERRER